jgi:hypothetical protein
LVIPVVRATRRTIRPAARLTSRSVSAAKVPSFSEPMAIGSTVLIDADTADERATAER